MTEFIALEGEHFAPNRESGAVRACERCGGYLELASADQCTGLCPNCREDRCDAAADDEELAVPCDEPEPIIEELEDDVESAMECIERADDDVPEIPATKLAFLAALSIDGLLGQLTTLVEQLDGARVALMLYRHTLRERSERAELVEARLALSDEANDKAGAGRNAETRKAWLILQGTLDAEFRAALFNREQALRGVERAETDYERVRAQYDGTRLALQLAREQLRFMSTGEV